MKNDVDTKAVKENFRKRFDEIFQSQQKKKPRDLNLRASQKPASAAPGVKSPNNGENDNDRR
jgi:hypothetical protein